MYFGLWEVYIVFVCGVCDAAWVVCWFVCGVCCVCMLYVVGYVVCSVMCGE